MITILMLCAAQLQEIESRLSARIPEVDFEATSLEDAVGAMRATTGLNIIMDPTSRTDETVTLKLRNLSARTIFKIMLGDKKLTLVYREGVLVVVPQDQVNRRVVTKVYDVGDLLMGLAMMPGPHVELIPPDAAGQTALGGAIFEIEEETKNPIDKDFLTDLLPQSTGGGKWDEVEGANITLVNNMLVITQSEKVHQEVADLLRMLRQYK